MTWFEQDDGDWLGFDDALLYRVKKDANGWYFESVHDMDGMDGYATADDAMDAADADYESHDSWFRWDDDSDPILTPDELEEIRGDRLFHERRDSKGLC